MSDADFAEAIHDGDHWMNAMTDQLTHEAQAAHAMAAAASYTKANAIATWRAAGRVQLIESSVLEHSDEHSNPET